MRLASDDPRHGTYNAYHNHGCRCEPCREANTEWWRHKRGRRAQFRRCPNCYGPGGTYANGECEACYQYRRKRGRVRPPEVYDPPPRSPCAICGKPGGRYRERCDTCYKYRKRNGVERPRRLWERAA